MDNIYMDIRNELFTLNTFAKDYLKFIKNNNILNKLSTENILTKYDIFQLEPYTTMLINTINIPDMPSYNILQYIIRDFIKNVNKFFNNDIPNKAILLKKLDILLIRSFIYRLLDRAGLYNLSKQWEEELLSMEKIELEIKTRPYENPLNYYEQEYNSFLRVTIGKFYEIVIVNTVNNHGFDVVYNNSKEVYSAHNLFKNPIVDLIHEDEWEDFDSFSTKYNAGFDAKVVTVYRSSLPTELYVSNTCFTEEKFRKYLNYNGKTVNKRAFIALIIPELVYKLIIYKNSKTNEYEFINNEKYYSSCIEDIIYFLDIEKFFKTNKYFRMTIQYMNNKKQFCIPVKIHEGVSYLYNFYKFEELLKTNSLQN